MDRFNQGWRRLNDKKSFLQRAWLDLKARKPLALDWALLWLSILVGVIIYLVRSA